LRVVRSGLDAHDKVIVGGLQKNLRAEHAVKPNLVVMARRRLRPRSHRSKEARYMDFSRFFIDRPIFAAVVSIVIVVAGLIAIPLLPIGEYPDVVRRRCRDCDLSGANRSHRRNRLDAARRADQRPEDMMYMKSVAAPTASW